MTPPFICENLVASIIESLKVLGDTLAIAVLATSTSSLDFVDYEFSQRNWRLRVCLPPVVFQRLSREKKEKCEERILLTGKAFFCNLIEEHLVAVKIAPSMSQASDDWREKALAFTRGQGISNQGRVRSDNIPTVEYQGLLFRSKPEAILFRAMVRKELAVAPLPVFVCFDSGTRRLEPDFVVVFKGLTFVIEVDGERFHRESPADADRRLIALTRQGVEVRRVNAKNLYSDEAADQVVDDLIEFMNNRKASR